MMEEAISPALKSLWASRNFIGIDLYVITLSDGTVLRWSGGDAPVRDGNLVYPNGGWIGPYWGLVGDNAQCHWELGTDVQTLTLSVLPGAAKIKGVSFVRAVAAGVFDGAWVEYRRAYLPPVNAVTYWPLAATGSWQKFYGRVGDISPAGGSVITFCINSIAEILQQAWPFEVYQPGCLNLLGDDACGIDLAAWAGADTVSAESSEIIIETSLTESDGWFSLGDITFSTGDLAGQSRSIRDHKAGLLTLMTPFPSAPAVGDGFTVRPGCDGTMDSGGCPKFANLDNWRAHPNVPPPSTAS